MGDTTPYVSASRLTMMEKCGEQYYRRYILGQKIPPDMALCTGKAVHKSSERDLKHKCDNDGKLFPDSDIKDIARDTLIEAVLEDGYTLTEEEKTIGNKKVIGRAVDSTVELAELHHKELAPIIEPISSEHVEKKFFIGLDGFEYDLHGFIDVVEKEGFRDLKTSGKKPNQEDIDRSLQYTTYALWYYSHNKAFPEYIAQDTIVKTKTPSVITNKTFRSEPDVDVFSNILNNFIQILKSGVFPHASSQSWWCAPKWCGYYKSCKYTRSIVYG